MSSDLVDYILRINLQKFKREKMLIEDQEQVIASEIENEKNQYEQSKKKWKKVATWCLVILAVLFLGLYAYHNFTYPEVESYFKNQFNEQFLFMLAVGFFAQMVDGALGMGYGVISTTMLLSGGFSPAVISGSIHTAEMFSSGASGFSHYKFGNVNKKLFKTLLIPGVIGAILGALLLGYVDEAYAGYIRPIISVYTFILGIRILSQAFKKKNTKPKKVKRAGWLAGAGGFLDSFGGGGWGPLVTSTLISKGRSPKYVIGSVSLTEFFVTMSSALTFFVILGTSHLESIIGLILGGLLAAPLAAKLVGKLPLKKMLIGVGVIVLLSSLRTILKSVGVF